MQYTYGDAPEPWRLMQTPKKALESTYHGSSRRASTLLKFFTIYLNHRQVHFCEQA